MARIQVNLNRDEMRALAQISQEQLRDPREQLRYLLRQHLEQCGMLPANEQAKQPAQQPQPPAVSK